jgi:hypothetical protein
LEAGEIFKVELRTPVGFSRGNFYAKLSGDGRFVVPKIVVRGYDLETKGILRVRICPIETQS